jgi:DNA modification methylase
LDENFPVLVSDDADGGKVITVYNEHGNVTMKVPSLEIIDPPSTVVFFNKPIKSELHPTMKPVGLCAKLIKNSTVAGDKVLDCFAGSGSTLMACEQLGRVCYAMELEPKYCDVIITRWEEFTGKKATRA